jgi:hypothetical protein
MHRHTRIAAVVVAAAALLAPSVALAGKPDHKHAKKEHAKKNKPARYVFKGVWHADGTVTVGGGNARVRKHDMIGATLAFDLTDAKLRAADADGDGSVTPADLLEGDKVVVKAWLPRVEPGEGPYVAKMLVDQTHPAVEESDDAAETPEVPEAPETPEAPEAPEAEQG